jgi:hypothetical protein
VKAGISVQALYKIEGGRQWFLIGVREGLGIKWGLLLLPVKLLLHGLVHALYLNLVNALLLWRFVYAVRPFIKRVILRLHPLDSPFSSSELLPNLKNLLFQLFLLFRRDVIALGCLL